MLLFHNGTRPPPLKHRTRTPPTPRPNTPRPKTAAQHQRHLPQGRPTSPLPLSIYLSLLSISLSTHTRSPPLRPNTPRRKHTQTCIKLLSPRHTHQPPRLSFQIPLAQRHNQLPPQSRQRSCTTRAQPATSLYLNSHHNLTLPQRTSRPPRATYACYVGFGTRGITGVLRYDVGGTHIPHCVLDPLTDVDDHITDPSDLFDVTNTPPSYTSHQDTQTCCPNKKYCLPTARAAPLPSFTTLPTLPLPLYTSWPSRSAQTPNTASPISISISLSPNILFVYI